MTINEYIDLLLSAGIIKDAPDTAPGDMLYYFTDKGFSLIREKFPEYPSSWPAAIWNNTRTNELEFWGVPAGIDDMYHWHWKTADKQEDMEYCLRNIFHVNPEDQADYIELDDIVL